MRKIIVMVLFVLVMMTSFLSVTFAKGSLIGQVQDPNLLMLGGIKLNNTKSHVINMYGEPTEQFKSLKPIKNRFFVEPYYLWEFHYGETVKLQFIQPISENVLYVTKVQSTANNGWKTPVGLAVGMKAEEIEKRKGKNNRQNTKGEDFVLSYHYGSFYLDFYQTNQY